MLLHTQAITCRADDHPFVSDRHEWLTRGWHQRKRIAEQSASPSRCAVIAHLVPFKTPGGSP